MKLNFVFENSTRNMVAGEIKYIMNSSIPYICCVHKNSSNFLIQHVQHMIRVLSLLMSIAVLYIHRSTTLCL